MPHYRAYRLTPDGKIKSGDWFEAPNDAEARETAHGFCNSDTPIVEVWQGVRFVARLPCDEEAGADAA